MAIKLSSNPTCVLSDADSLTAEQRQRLNLNLTKGIPGSDIEGDKVTVINSDGEVEMKAYSAGGGGLGYESASTASVTLTMNDLVVNDSVDVTSITVASGVTSGIVQWTVDSNTTLPTVVDGNNNALAASVNNPSSLTVGRTVQVSILNGTWTCSEFA